MTDLPAGTVTFLLTDIEGSTRLWEQHPQAMAAALARHDALIAEAVSTYGGALLKTRGEGDSTFAVFARATTAVAAALAAQRALAAAPWGETGPLAVRMALHTGEAELRDGDYFGAAVNRCARLRAVAHGGQVLLSLATSELVRDRLPAKTHLRDLGEHRLRDLDRPERAFQLGALDVPADFPPLRSLAAVPTNLPRQPTSFVGREGEMAEVTRLLAATGLLTLTGAGGVGKTRLALQVAADSLDAYADGVWLVELAAIADPTLACAAVARTLGVREEPGRLLLDTLTGSLRSRRIMLVLDNCEHLVGACATLADALLRTCLHLTILATSREALGIGGETVYRVPSLATPDPGPPLPVEVLTQYAAVRLFIDRAVAAAPGFAVTNANAPAVAAICYQLDGIALAIELAAARVRVLAADQIAARLDDRLRLLTGGSRTALARQQTLRAAIDWSHDLLSEVERVLLRRLAVFAGGWTLEAAEAVCAGDGIDGVDVLDLLARLVDKSLVVTVEVAGRSRYVLLETMRQYAEERLAASGEGAGVRGRHLDWFGSWAERAHEALTGRDQGEWLGRLSAEDDNLRAALAWALERAEPESALWLAWRLGRFWQILGHIDEGRRWLERAVATCIDVPPPARAMLLNRTGQFAQGQGDYRRATALYEESVAIFRARGDTGWIVAVGTDLGVLARSQGDLTRAVALLEEGVRLARDLGDKRALAATLHQLGGTVQGLGDLTRAAALLEESLALWRELGDRRGMIFPLRELGVVAQFQGDIPKAAALYEECLAMFRELGETPGVAGTLTVLGVLLLTRAEYVRATRCLQESLALVRDMGQRSGIAACLEALAGVAGAQGRPEQACRLLGAGAALREATGGTVPAPYDRLHARLVRDMRAALGEEAFALAWAAGQALPLDQAIAEALGEADDG